MSDLKRGRTVRMTPDLFDALDHLSETKGMNGSQVLRLALQNLLVKEEQEIKLSNQRQAEALELSNAAADTGLAQMWAEKYDDRLGH